MAAYGRLDVYWPDGPIESYPLDKPTVAVGRSTGNDIALDTTAVSRYHISISLHGDQVVLEDLDSVNGTYIDGVRLPGHQPHPLRDGEEIQIGDIRLIFHPANNPTQELADLQPAESDQPTFKVEVDDSDQAVTPGAHVQTVINVQNVGSEMDHYTIVIDGVPKEWIRLDRSEMELPPNVRSQVILSFKPLRRFDSKPGEYPLKVKVLSREHPAQNVEVPIKLHLLSFSGFGIVLGTPRVQTGTPADIFVQNQGSAPLPLSIRGADPAGYFDYEIQPASLTLDAGEKRTLHATMRPKRRQWMGENGDHRFDIIAQSRDASGFQAAVSGTVVNGGGLPPILLLILPIGALVVAVALLLGAAVIIPALQPTTTPTATLTHTAVPSSTPIAVIIPTWTPVVTNTATLLPVTATETPSSTATLILVPPSVLTTTAPTQPPEATTTSIPSTTQPALTPTIEAF